jgi:hypothetical protein
MGFLLFFLQFVSRFIFKVRADLLSKTLTTPCFCP